MIRNLATDNWITVLFVLWLGILVVLNFLYPLKFKDFIPFFKKEQFYTKYFKTFVKSDLFFLLFGFFALLVYSFLLFKVTFYYHLSDVTDPLLHYFRIVGVSFWYVIIRYFMGKIIDFIFKIKNLQESFLYYKWIYLSKNALLLVPFLVIFQYYHFAFGFVILAVILAIILVYNYFVLLAKNQKNIFKHLFYFILYLCTLEIAPLIIYFKIVFNV